MGGQGGHSQGAPPPSARAPEFQAEKIIFPLQ